jgi:hypothetical protein
LQIKYLKRRKVGNSQNRESTLSKPTSDDDVPLSDCIETEIDSVGFLNGFKLRPEMMDIVHWKNSFDLKNVLKIVKSVNLMNRLLLHGEIKKNDFKVVK